MRFGGQKLSPKELRAAARVRGILTVTTSTITRIGDKGATYATLTNSRMSEPLLPALREAHISKSVAEQALL